MGHCPQGSPSLVGRKEKEVEMDHRGAGSGVASLCHGRIEVDIQLSMKQLSQHMALEQASELQMFKWELL